MERSLLPDNGLNGGFPEPLATEPVRVIAARHAACGEATRVRLPRAVPARAVRRMRCLGCERTFDVETVEELGLIGPEAAAAAGAVAEAAAATEPQLEPTAAAPYDVEASAAKPRSRPKLNLPSIAPLRARLAALLGPPIAKLRDRPPKRAGLPELDPESRSWKLASIPIAGALVIGGLLVLQGAGGEPDSPTLTAIEAKAASGSTAAGAGRDREPKIARETEVVSGSSYSLALPEGWERIEPSGGATFAAVAPDGGADAALWIEEDPGLDFPTFISQSMRQLEALAGSASVVERVPAPTPEATIVRLAAEPPAGQPTYEVTLRVAGPYRYYLATSVQPDASRDAASGADLVAGSFTPEETG